jgi:hypothetical protein
MSLRLPMRLLMARHELRKDLVNYATGEGVPGPYSAPSGSRWNNVFDGDDGTFQLFDGAEPITDLTRTY